MANDRMPRKTLNLLKLTLARIPMDSPCTVYKYTQVYSDTRISTKRVQVPKIEYPQMRTMVRGCTRNANETRFSSSVTIQPGGGGERAKLKRNSGSLRTTRHFDRGASAEISLPFCRAKFGISKQTSFIRSPVDDEIRIAKRQSIRIDIPLLASFLPLQASPPCSARFNDACQTLLSPNAPFPLFSIRVSFS